MGPHDLLVPVSSDLTAMPMGFEAHPARQDTNKLNGRCHFFIQAHCKFGYLCKHSHGDPPGKVTASPAVHMPVRAFDMILSSAILIKSLPCRLISLRLRLTYGNIRLRHLRITLDLPPPHLLRRIHSQMLPPPVPCFI